jgi:hypothetical protein
MSMALMLVLPALVLLPLVRRMFVLLTLVLPMLVRLIGWGWRNGRLVNRGLLARILGDRSRFRGAWLAVALAGMLAMPAAVALALAAVVGAVLVPLTGVPGRAALALPMPIRRAGDADRIVRAALCAGVDAAAAAGDLR